MALRVAAWLLDFLIAFFIGIAFAGVADVRTVIIVVLVAQFIYARVTGTSLGRQIIGTRRPWLRAAAGFVIVLYLGLTIGAGTMIAAFTDEKIDTETVDIRAAAVELPFQARGGVRHEFPDVSFETPRSVGGKPVEVSNCCIFFGGYADAEKIDPGILIFVDEGLHPYDYCTRMTVAATNYLAGCRATPAEFQRAVIDARRNDRWSVWNPAGVVRTNFTLVAKTIYLDDVVPSETVRHFRRGSADVYWFRGRREMKKKAESALVDLDRFMIADGTRFTGVDIVWKKVPRDAEVAEMIASSLQMRDGSPPAATADRVALMNAFRLNPDRADIAAALRDELSKSGTTRERRYFRMTIATRAGSNREVAAVAGSVAQWE